MPFARALLIGLTTLLASQTQAADETRWYQVEVVIFENTSLGDAEREVWPENPGKNPGTPELLGLGTLNSPPAGFAVRDRSELELGGAKTHLARSGKYKPILHFAWRQPGLAKEIAVPIRIRGGLRYVAPIAVAPGFSGGMEPLSTPQDPPSGGAVTSGLQTDTSLATLNAPQEIDQIDGTLMLVLGRYLHLHTDLLYRRMVPAGALRTSSSSPLSTLVAQPTLGSKVMTFRMQQQRKMRSKELHYIDHPLFGVLVKVNPVKPDGSISEEETAPAETAQGE